MNKSAFIDLDGTLLTSTAKIRKDSLQSLSKLKEKNIDIAICTGRWPISAFVYNEQVENYCNVKNKYLISMNGSVIYDLYKNQIIKSYIVDDKILKKLFSLQKKYKVAIWVYNKRGVDNKNIYCNGIPLKKIVGYFNYGKLIKIKYDSFDFQNDTYKVLYLSFNKRKIQKLYNWLVDNLSDYVDIIKVSKFAIEIVSKDSSKGNAIKYISSLSNIDLKNSYAFGDSNNDVSMFNVINNCFTVNSESKTLKNKAVLSFFGKNAFSMAVENGIINPIIKQTANYDDIDQLEFDNNYFYEIKINKKMDEFKINYLKKIKKIGIKNFNLCFLDGFSIDENKNIIKSSFIDRKILYEIQSLLKNQKSKIFINYIHGENFLLKNKKIKINKKPLLRSKYIYSIIIKKYDNSILEKISKFNLNIKKVDSQVVITK